MHRRARLFYNGRSQAVRLPKEFRLPGTEVFVHSEGRSVILTPIPHKLGELIDDLAKRRANYDDFAELMREIRRDDRAEPMREVEW